MPHQDATRPFSLGSTALASLLLCALAAVPGQALDPQPEASHEREALRGRILCLDAASVEAGVQDPCNQPGARFALETEEGETVFFLASDPRAGVFLDPRVRSQLVEVRGWRRAGSAFELLSVYTIHDGRLHHVHYRCDVCNITATAPGPCWCCGRDFELRQEPVDENDLGQ